MVLSEEMIKKAKEFAVINRLEYGKASPKHVFSRFMREYKDKIDHSKIPIYLQNIEEICNYVNSLKEDDLKKIGNMLEKADEKNTDMHPKKIFSLEEMVHNLKPLPNVEKEVITRFEPSPSGPLHIGHVFPLLLNFWYAKKYDGKMILRIADTNPRNILPEAYEMIVEDVEYLTGKMHAPVIQSERMKYYYEVCEFLLEKGFAYVCECNPDEFKKHILEKRACPHRERDISENIEKWEKMKSGEYKEGECVVRIKTLLAHENPAVREWVAFRVINEEHPRLGDKYCTYPTMNFAVAVDDHSNGITHVIRGKDHEINTLRQEYIFDYLGWKKPTYIHIGRINFSDLKLSTTQIKEKIRKGEFTGWDDVRLPFLRSYRKRGFKREAFSFWVLEIGPTKRDKKTTYSEFMKNFIKIHRALIDKEADRAFFVKDKIKVKITNLDKEIKALLPLHPEDKNRGMRIFLFSPSSPYVYIEKEDWKNLPLGETLRLKYAFDIKKKSENECEIVTKQTSKHDKVVHYIPCGYEVKCKVYMDNGDVLEGIVESSVLDKEPGSILQFERFGFVKLHTIKREKLYIEVETYYIHR